jgi:hypothetical protein
MRTFAVRDGLITDYCSAAPVAGSPEHVAESREMGPVVALPVGWRIVCEI